ncbi:MAG: FAD-binding oxidoreductase [Rhodocyclaceae bacterium]|nr:FAD-binding oxidoreductase [Rhodocyclaceae bacterium]
MSIDLLNRLAAIVGPTHVLTEAGDVAPHAEDWRGRYRGVPLAVVRPADAAQVAAVVAASSLAGVPLVPQGGNTGLCGGATPVGGELVVDLRRLDRIRGLDADNNTIAVEAGCPLQRVQEAAEAEDRLFPLSLAAEGTATVGGNLSTNAGGVQVLRYGNMRDLVLGVEAVLPDGRLWDGMRALRKDNTGYDLKQLFIGAEGTLGIVTAMVLKLFPRPRVTATAWVAVRDPARAVALLGRLRARTGDRVTAFELVGRKAFELVLAHIPGTRNPLPQPNDWQVLLELSDTLETPLRETLADLLEEAALVGEVEDAAVAASEAQAAAFWRLRESASEAQKREGLSIKHDIAVPVSRIAEFVERADAALAAAFPGVRIVCFGHVGDGNLHYNQSRPEDGDDRDFIAHTEAVNRIVHDIVNDLGGTISAEHGLGQLKRLEILRYKSPLEIGMMRAVKAALDPHGLMNPGKLL